MPASPSCWNASTPCRVEWRPSPLACASLVLLGALAGIALIGSDLPRALAWPAALLALARGLQLAWRCRRQPSRTLLWPAEAGPVLLDGVPIDALRLHWRGPWLFLHWQAPPGALESGGGKGQRGSSSLLARLRRCGRGRHRQALAWWPDTLDRQQRRELRLVAGAGDAARLPPSVAT